MRQTTSTILMVRPASFGFNAETAVNNAFQGKLDLTAEIIQQRAEAEFDTFVEKLRKEGVNVLVIQDSQLPAKPDAVFPNNWFCSLPDGRIHLFPMYAPVRRLERRKEIIETISKGFGVTEVIDWSSAENREQILEGTGSIIFDHIHRLAFACLSPRTNARLMRRFCLQTGYSPILFSSEDENGMLIYHTNVMLHIGSDYAVVCLESIRSEQERRQVIEQLSLGGKQIVDISLEQVRNYAGNMLQVENSRRELITAMSRKALDSLTDSQRKIIEARSRIVAADIPVIETIGGGSARCMMAEIFLKRR